MGDPDVNEQRFSIILYFHPGGAHVENSEKITVEACCNVYKLNSYLVTRYGSAGPTISLTGMQSGSAEYTSGFCV